MKMREINSILKQKLKKGLEKANLCVLLPIN